MALSSAEGSARTVMLYGNSSNANQNWAYVNETPNGSSGTLTLYTGNYGASIATNVQFFSNGNMTIRGTLTQNSDSRLKTNIKPLSNSLSKISQIRPVSYNRRSGLLSSDLSDERINHGFIADEIQSIFPNLVLKDDTSGVLSLDYTGIFVTGIDAIKDLNDQVQDLTEQVKDLTNQIQDIKKLIS